MKIMDVLFFRPQPLSCSQSLYYSRLQSSLPISSLMKRVLNVMRSPKLAHIFVDSVWTPRPIVGNLNFSNGKRLGSRHCFTSPLQTPSPKSRFSRLFSEMFRRRYLALITLTTLSSVTVASSCSMANLWSTP